MGKKKGGKRDRIFIYRTGFLEQYSAGNRENLAMYNV